MKYFVSYSHSKPLVMGKIFDTVDDAVATATTSLLNYYDKKGDTTSEIFGIDIETAKDKKLVDDMYNFKVYELVDSDRTELIESVNLWKIVRLTRESKLQQGMLALCNKEIIHEMMDLELFIYFARIIYGLDAVEEKNDISEVEDYIIEAYISLIKITHNYELDEVLKFEFVKNNDYKEEIKNLALSLDEVRYFGDTVKNLILYLWEKTETKFDTDFVEFISKNINVKFEM